MWDGEYKWINSEPDFVLVVWRRVFFTDANFKLRLGFVSQVTELQGGGETRVTQQNACWSRLKFTMRPAGEMRQKH